MKPNRKKFWSHDNRFRLMLTLVVAVLLPAGALIYVNFQHLKSIKRDKNIEALIYRDFQYVLAMSEKKLNQKAFVMVEDLRTQYPSPDETEPEKIRKLDLILSKNPTLAHVFLFDREKGFVIRSQPQQMGDEYVRKEHGTMAETYSGWFGMEGKMLVEGLHKKSRPMNCYTSPVKRDFGEAYMTGAYFVLPNVPKNRVTLAGASFDPKYLKQTFFPEMLEELIAQKLTEDKGERLAMVIYPMDYEGGQVDKPIAASAGWTKGKPEVSRKLDDVFRGLALGIKFQGTSAEAIGHRWVVQSFLILGALSVMMIGGLVLTYRSVSKEMALAHLKSDFVSNVSHELRTPLALIRLYAETLELGRITTAEKKEEYYRIIRKESERLTALINNILDFSRIEAGRKEYDFRETDIAELVSNTLDAYRYQIEQQGFAFEQSIDTSIPKVRVDREAIARALVNLVNNALKYSANEKFLGVRLYRSNSVLKLEVIDRGIGITRREQSKIFEKFYRTGDPLVHNTKGSGLGLSLVRHITQAHGGDVEVESTPGKGSKFILSLPLAAISH
ncbi:MAG: HAMP domain-containing sensor histidine kinase [Pyrinomonadaceae bacterium]